MSEPMRLCMCGLPAQSYTTESANGVVRYAIGCNDWTCQWTAGEFATEAAAIAAWNRRAAPKPAPEALHGYWHVEPIEGQMPTITTTFCQGCQEKENELPRLRNLDRAVKNMRRFKVDTLVWQLNYDIVGILAGEKAYHPQPGDPCEECKPTNRCPFQNPCPVKQIWLEGKEVEK